MSNVIEVEVKNVEKLSMSDTDVLFVTVSGDPPPEMLGHLTDALKELLGHQRFMVITDSIKLQLVSGKEAEEPLVYCDNCEQEPCVCKPREA